MRPLRAVDVPVLMASLDVDNGLAVIGRWVEQNEWRLDNYRVAIDDTGFSAVAHFQSLLARHDYLFKGDGRIVVAWLGR